MATRCCWNAAAERVSAEGKTAYVRYIRPVPKNKTLGAAGAPQCHSPVIEAHAGALQQSSRWRRWGLAVAALMVGSTGSSWAGQLCERISDDVSPAMVVLRVDNDFFVQQDQGYSSGVQLKLVSENLAPGQDDACQPDWARWLGPKLDWLSPSTYDQRNLTIGAGQFIYTPIDPDRSDLVLDDRPYAGLLLFSAGTNARRANELWVSQLTLGVVGPASLAEHVQRQVHRWTGSDRFRGWDHQLKNEPLFMLLHERSQRWGGRPLWVSAQGLRWDAVTHWGGSLGNLRSAFDAGVEFRLGQNLPDDFGSSPLRPGGENTTPQRRPSVRDGWSWHGFLSLDARLVFQDITLDGNTFRDSHEVDRRVAGGDVTAGVAVMAGRWKLTVARTSGTRQFDEQRHRPAFGRVALSYAL